MTEFAEWDSFYLIVGGAAGALIGLQFVVMTLISGRTHRPDYVVGAAFATPTIIHFGAVLLLAAFIRAPWREAWPPAALWGLIGLVGVIYIFVVLKLMRAQTLYKPVFEDWLFHAILPLLAYAILLTSALVALSLTRQALFGVAAAALMLLFIGIHNAWDTVTYNVFVTPEKAETEKAKNDTEVPDED